MNRLPLEDVLAMCKQIGIFSSSCSIYGGMPGIFDYGPLGAEIKIHLRKAWWQAMVYDRDDVYGIEAALLTSPLLHEHSGFLGANYEEFGVFETRIKDENNNLSPCHLRVTTAQHSFANFDNVVEWTHPSLPFGIAQIGKAFRNEQQVTDFPVRMREFEQMELQYFVPTENTQEWHEFWLKQRLDWWEQQGINLQNLIVDDVVADELAHYSSKTYDIHYKQPNGDIFEIEGIADRGDFDCGSHSGSQDKLHLSSSVLPNNMSTALMAITQPGTETLIAPCAIEPAAGVDRGLMAVLFESFVRVDSSDGTSRVVLRIKPHLAPVKACLHIPNSNAILSIESASIIKHRLQRLAAGKIVIEIGGDKQKVTKYHDEVGTPFLITLEDSMLNDNIVIVRERDTGVTEHMPIEQFYIRFESIYS
ncbi:aminoacyl--tRNA ligase-related protein [Pseudomonas helvetica]|uniref:aminoacyl--tRNA ligase-related protein n=1 Tax=Pseudomonas helvetica TaxID=3136738 RepID=UPI003266B502